MCSDVARHRNIIRHWDVAKQCYQPIEKVEQRRSVGLVLALGGLWRRRPKRAADKVGTRRKIGPDYGSSGGAFVPDEHIASPSRGF